MMNSTGWEFFISYYTAHQNLTQLLRLRMVLLCGYLCYRKMCCY